MSVRKQSFLYQPVHLSFSRVTHFQTMYVMTGPFTFILTLICVLCFRDTAVEFVCRTHVTVVDGVTSLNTDYVLIQMRRCATVLLLFAAFWSLVSTFVPTTAQPSSCTPFSWLTLKDVLDKIARLEHYGPPPT